MKDLEFMGLAVRVMTTALLALGLVGSAFGADVAPVAPEAGQESNATKGQAVTVDLAYREVGYSFVDWNVSMTTRSGAFQKEPKLSPTKVIRGSLRLGSRDQETGFAWDQAAGKLYLDLNRNQDLTDDPGGVFSSRGGAR